MVAFIILGRKRTTMFSLRSSLVKAVFSARVKVRDYIDAISRRIGASILSDSQEGTDDNSARFFCFVNIVFLVSVILLSPDKVAEVLPSARPSWLASGWFQEVAETLRKLTPF